MLRIRLLRTGAVALAMATMAAGALPSRAADEKPALRERISAGIAAGLAAHPDATPATPQPLTSHPARLATERPAPSRTAGLPPAPSVRDTTSEGTWNDLVAGNARFAAGQPRAVPPARSHEAQASESRPRAVILGCSDSGESPERVFDALPGDLFVVRTEGNIVDPIALGSIEYAVDRQHACLLVVLGHGGCGAVKAAATPGDMPSSHLQAIVDRIRPTVQRLANCFEGDELVERSVIANARQSATDVLANSQLLRDAAGRGRLKVVSAVFDPRTGLVTAVSAPAATAQAQAPAR